MQSWRALRGRKREEQGGWGETPGAQPLPQAGSQNFLNWGPEGQPGRAQVYCLSVCLSVCLGLSPRPLLPLTPSSSALHLPLWVRGAEGRCRWLWHFLPHGSYCKEAGRGYSSGGKRGEEMRAGFQAAENRGRFRGKGGSLFLGKPPLTTPAPGDCPLP